MNLKNKTLLFALLFASIAQANENTETVTTEETTLITENTEESTELLNERVGFNTILKTNETSQEFFSRLSAETKSLEDVLNFLSKLIIFANSSHAHEIVETASDLVEEVSEAIEENDHDNDASKTYLNPENTILINFFVEKLNNDNLEIWDIILSLAKELETLSVDFAQNFEQISLKILMVRDLVQEHPSSFAGNLSFLYIPSNN